MSAKSLDEVKKGLECCTNLWDCKNKDCPYLGDGCYPKLHEDFKALNQQLQAENAEQAEKIRQLEADVESLRKFGENLSARNEELHGKLIDLEAERDVMESELVGTCQVCRWEETAKCVSCHFCEYAWNAYESNWEWRGVQKEDSDA